MYPKFISELKYQYFKYKADRNCTKKANCIKRQKFDKAAEYRNKERKYLEKMKPYKR